MKWTTTHPLRRLSFLKKFVSSQRNRHSSRRYPLNMERLEAREMLAANHLATFEGAVTTLGVDHQLSLTLGGTHQPVVVSIHVESANESTLDPVAPRLEDLAGTPIATMESNDNVSHGQNGIVTAALPAGEFNLFIGSEKNTTGDFSVSLILPGDLSGDGQVGLQEQQTAMAAMVQSQFGFNHVSSQVFSNLRIDVSANLYDPGLDADMNGIIEIFDWDVINTNMNQPTVQVEFADATSVPVIAATVNGDTGRSDSDGITNDLNMTIDGTISDGGPNTSFTASVDGSTSTDLGALLGQDFSGSAGFSLNLSQLETIADTGVGSLTDSGTHTLTLAIDNGEGNPSAEPLEITFELDTVAPAAPIALDLDSSSDKGTSSTDNLTNETALTIHADAEDNALVELFSSLVITPIGSHIVNSPVTIDTDPLPSGTQDITGVATDPAGNTSDQSDPLTVTIDNTPPGTPTFDLDAASDTGSIGDHLTTESLVTIASNVEENASVQLQRAETTVASGTADGSGTFNFNGITLPFGNSEFTVIASDAAGNSSSSSENFTRNNAPVIDDQSLAVAENSLNDTVVGTVVTDDDNLGEGDSLQYAITGGNATGAFSIGGATGVVTVADSSQLDFESSPVFALTVHVTDIGGDGSGTPGTGLSDTAVVTINLNDANDPPVVDNATFSLAENSPIDTAVGTVTASDSDTVDSHIFAINGGNTNGAFSIDANSGEITVANSAALDFETLNSFSLTVTATDNGGLDDSATVTINLTDVNEPPTVAEQTFSVSFSIPDDFVLGTISVADPDAGDTFAFEIIASNPSTSLFAVDSSTGAISVPDSSALTPDTTFVLTVQATDMGGTGFSDDADIVINVIPNILPIAVDDTVSTDEDTSLSVDVLADNGSGADSDPDGDDSLLSVTAFDATSNLGATITQQVDGRLLYNPTGASALQTLGVGASATDTFTYEISDEVGGKDTATVSITVLGVNDTPTAADDGLATDEDSDITFDPLVDNGNGADSDPDAGDILSISDFDTASSLGATVALIGNGTIQYDPQTSPTLQALSGTDTPVIDTFTYSVSDANGESDTATVSVTVSGVDENVVAVGEVFKIAQDTNNHSFATVANDSTSSGFAGTLSVASATTTVSGATAAPSGDGQSIIYTPASGFLGRDVVTYTVSDVGGGSDTAKVTVEVTTGLSDLQEHIHAKLSVFVNGVRLANPPSHIGVESLDGGNVVFTSEVHTHHEDGEIHVHPVNGVTKTEFSNLGDFFDTWRTNAGLAGNNPDAIFNENQIFDNVVDQNHEIRMFVNGLPNLDFENYVIEDQDEIVILYESVVDAATPDFLPSDDVDMLSGSPMHIPLDGFDLQHDTLIFSAESSNPSLVEATVLTGNRSMVVTVEDVGVMNFQLFDNRTPRVTNQISSLAPDYSGVPFHRVIDEFMIQGGDITNGNGTGGSSLGEFDDQFHVDLQHNRTGLLSMAKTADDTNDSQFFVTEGATRHLDFNHSIFGILIEGERIRELISNVDTNSLNAPLTPVLMDNVQIITDPENGALMLKAPEGASGEADVTVTVDDNNGNTLSRTFHVTVTPDAVDGSPFLGELPATVTTTSGQPATISVDGGASDLVLDVEGDPFFVDVLERGSIIAFDHTGDDADVTSNGTTDFSFNGSNWTGGQVVSSSGFGGLFASRPGGYLINTTGGQVTFDDPVNSVSFYYTHGQGGVLAGTASAFDAVGNPIDTSPSGNASPGNLDGDPDNFVSFSSNALISRVEFSGGLIDDFNFRRFTFELNGAADQITVTPQPGVTGTLPIQLRLRPNDPSNTGTGFDLDTQNMDLVFGNSSPLTAQMPVPLSGNDAASENIRFAAMLQSQSSTIDELVQTAVDFWTYPIELDSSIDVIVELTDFPDDRLAEAVSTELDAFGLPTAGTILLDKDAAGAVWHTDIATQPSDDAFDLFTVILHEVGHLLGFDQALAEYQTQKPGVWVLGDESGQHLDAQQYPDDLMTADLPVGTRRIPSAFDLHVLHNWYEDTQQRIWTPAEKQSALDAVYAELGAA